MLLQGYQTFTQACGNLPLLEPRDAFLANLCEFALAVPGEPGGEGDSFSPRGGPQDKLASPRSALAAAAEAAEAGLVLAPKNVQSMRTLFNIAHRLSNVLGPAWALVLETMNTLVRGRGQGGGGAGGGVWSIGVEQEAEMIVVVGTCRAAWACGKHPAETPSPCLRAAPCPRRTASSTRRAPPPRCRSRGLVICPAGSCVPVPTCLPPCLPIRCLPQQPRCLLSPHPPLLPHRPTGGVHPERGGSHVQRPGHPGGRRLAAV